MSETTTQWVKVQRAHPDFSHHVGEIVELSTEKVEKYAEYGPFFGHATPEEITRQQALNETATRPAQLETATLPTGGPKTPAQAAELLAKGAQSAAKDANK